MIRRFLAFSAFVLGCALVHAGLRATAPEHRRKRAGGLITALWCEHLHGRDDEHLASALSNPVVYIRSPDADAVLSVRQ